MFQKIRLVHPVRDGDLGGGLHRVHDDHVPAQVRLAGPPRAAVAVVRAVARLEAALAGGGFSFETLDKVPVM